MLGSKAASGVDGLKHDRGLARTGSLDWKIGGIAIALDFVRFQGRRLSDDDLAPSGEVVGTGIFSVNLLVNLLVDVRNGGLLLHRLQKFFQTRCNSNPKT